MENNLKEFIEEEKENLDQFMTTYRALYNIDPEKYPLNLPTYRYLEMYHYGVFH